jgi:hypothetical protein
MAAKTKKSKPAEPEMTLEEIRAALDGQEKEIFLVLSKAEYETPSFLKGKTLDDLSNHMKSIAKRENFPEDFKLDHRSIPVTKERSKWDGRLGKRVRRETTENEGPYWVLVAFEPYTDEELRAKGAGLIAAKKRREAAAAKNLAKKVDAFNLQARALGQPTITIEDLT